LYLPGHRHPEKDRLRIVSEVCFLVLLPVWGFFTNWSLHVCQACQLYPSQALRTPDVIGLYVLYAASLIAYTISRRQPRRLRPITEMWLTVFLLIGVILCLALAVQFGKAMLLGLLFGFIGIPLVAPLVALAFLSVELLARRKQRVGQAGMGAQIAVGLGSVLSLWALVHRWIFQAWPWDMFTKTCDWYLSQLQPPPGDCHYLCTVAAQGSRWLVRPQRFGLRHGRTIVVNRQLCVANAFEDLLHSRWPRFGRVCRQTYDRLGWPVSRLLCNKLLANLVYLLMKPAEWFFSICLLLFDNDNPEKRIDRMYQSDIQT